MTRTCCATALALAMAVVQGVHGLELDAESFVRRVDAHSRELELARLDIGTANAERQSARSRAFPRVDASAAYAREALDQPVGLPSYSNNVQLSGTMSQTLFDMKISRALPEVRRLRRRRSRSGERSPPVAVRYTSRRASQVFFGTSAAPPSRAPPPLCLAATGPDRIDAHRWRW